MLLSTSRRRQRNRLAALAIVFLLAGAGVLGFYWQRAAAATRGESWTQQVATIEQASALVLYSYDVGGRTYRRSSPNAATRYAKGQKIIAYVNPQNPTEAIIAMDPKPNPRLALIGVLVLAIGGVFAILAAQRERHPNVVRSKPRAAPLSRLRPPPPVVRKPPDEAKH